MLKPLTSEYLPHLLRIEVATQISPWTEGVFQRCFEAGSLGWVFEISGRIVGFILQLIQGEETHILNICVDPEYQHQGLGQQLLEKALEESKIKGAHLAYLEVRISNRKAISLYKKMGFMQIGERKNYYIAETGRENALIFAKDLSAGYYSPDHLR